MIVMDKYKEKILVEVQKALEVAKKARSLYLDPSPEVEIPLAEDIASRVESLVGTVEPKLLGSGVQQRIRELEVQFGKNDERIGFEIAKDVSENKFVKFKKPEEQIEAGLRVGVAYITLGIVTAPLEGITHIKIKQRMDGGNYLAIYFSGPIRSAGGTAAAMAVLIADYLRQLFNIGSWDPAPNEIERYVVEVDDYDRVANLQYRPSNEKLRFILSRLPVEINGEPTEKIDVLSFKDLPRIETNRIRGGMCLTLCEGVASKAPKLYKKVKKYGKDYRLDGWEWLKDAKPLTKTTEVGVGVKPNYAYMEEIPAGRPLFSDPSEFGGFRLRYGRSRNTGLAGIGIHPAAMIILGGFPAVGTQLRLERPGKAGVVAPVDSIRGPVVLLKNSSVIDVRSEEQAKKILADIKEILFIGDILVATGEFSNNGHPLIPSAWCEEWWLQELEKAKGSPVNKNPFTEIPDPATALEISKRFNIPMHPRYTYPYHALSVEQLKELAQWLFSGEAKMSGGKIVGLELENAPQKRLLELLWVPHELNNGRVIIGWEALPLLTALGYPEKKILESTKKNSMEIIDEISPVKIMQLAPSFIGARMGRPEKAERREMKGKPMVLFPVTEAGGRFRSVNCAADGGKITSELALRLCKSCGKRSFYLQCPYCGGKTKQRRVCRKCHKIIDSEIHCGISTSISDSIDFNIGEEFKKACDSMGFSPELLKGVKGMSSADKIPEHLEKGVLRAKHNLLVNKEGTVRFDSTDVPLTHFCPREVGVPVDKLKQLGYEKDINGTPLTNDDQILELFSQDILISDHPQGSCVDWLIRVCNFIDELLVKFYKLEPYYNVKSRGDLIGQLVVGLAPHTSAGIVGRIIGFTKARGGFAHPIWHAGKRRNCVVEGERGIILNDGHPVCIPIENIRPGMRVLTNDPKTGALVEKRVLRVYRQPKQNHLLRIRTKAGKQVTVTPEHKLFVHEKNQLVPRRALEIREGDLLASPASIMTEQRDVVLDTFSHLKNEKDLMVRSSRQVLDSLIRRNGGLSSASKKAKCTMKALDNFRRRGSTPLSIYEKLGGREVRSIGFSRRKESVPASIRPTEAFMKLLGYYLAEGYARKGERCFQVCICTSDKHLAQDIQRCCRKVFGYEPRWDGRMLVISGRLFYWLFEELLGLGEGAYTKHVPTFVFNLDERLRGALLSAYFSGDGSIDKFVTCCSVNKRLLEQIEHLLLSFGIFPHWQVNEKTITKGPVAEFYKRKGRPPVKSKVWLLRIYSKDIKTFADKIGFVHRGKQKKLVKLLSTNVSKKHKTFSKFGDSYLLPVKSVEIVKNDRNMFDIEVEDVHSFVCNGIVSKNCDGDEDSILLLMDAFLNFSRLFLPNTRGGKTMDAPLVLTTIVDPQEVDDEVWGLDTTWKLPLEFYHATLKYADADSVEIRRIKNQLNNPLGEGFTHPTIQIDAGPLVSSYTTLATMLEKVEAQLELGRKIYAVDENREAEILISSHFLKDIKGNIRTYCRQSFRCTTCNKIYRRIPLMGRCTCGGNLVLTVAQGSVEKYLKPSQVIAEKFQVSDYMKQELRILERRLKAMFGQEKEMQKDLSSFFGKV